MPFKSLKILGFFLESVFAGNFIMHNCMKYPFKITYIVTL